MRSSCRSAGERLAARQHLVAALLLSLFAGVYLAPVLTGGKVLVPIGELYLHPPWRSYAPPDLGSYYNPLLTDIASEMYPWRFLVRQLLHAGSFPAWNPYVMGGVPLFANPQAGAVSLFNLPLWILPLNYGLGVSAAVKLAVGGTGAYVLARQLRLGFLPGLLAGIAFAFASINIVWLSHAEHPGVAVMLPWAIWLVERVFAHGRVGSALGLAFVAAVGLGGGHPGMQLHFLFVVGLYALARAAWPYGSDRVRDRRRRLRSLALVGGALAAAGLLMAFMLLPEWRSGAETVGVVDRRARSLPGQHMPFGAIQSALFPDRWGRPSATEITPRFLRPGHLIVNFNERTFYAGVIALLFACIGAALPSARRRTAPFIVVGLFGLAVAVHVPGAYWLATHLPVLDSVEPERLHFAFEFAIALLGAFGLQALLDAPARQRWRLAVPAGALLIGVVALATSGASGSDYAHTVRHFLTGVDYPDAQVLALTSIGWFLLFACAVGAALLLARRFPGRAPAIGLALVALAAADAYHFAHGLNPMTPAAKAIPPVTPAIAYLERHRDDGRIVGFGVVMPNDWGIMYGLDDARGYDPPQPTRRMLELWRIANPTQLGWVAFRLTTVNERVLNVLNLLATRYLVFPPEINVGDAPGDALRTVYRGSDAMIVENTAAAPHALVPSSVLVTEGRQATDAMVAEGAFDPRTTVVVERERPGAGELAGLTAGVRGSAAIVRRENTSVTLDARLDRRGLVVLNDALVQGWGVHVDGRPARAIYVDGVMRGVVVPAGRHRIVWSYDVPGLRLGALLSLLTLAGLAAASLVLFVRGRRPPVRRRVPAVRRARSRRPVG